MPGVWHLRLRALCSGSGIPYAAFVTCCLHVSTDPGCLRSPPEFLPAWQLLCIRAPFIPLHLLLLFHRLPRSGPEGKDFKAIPAGDACTISSRTTPSFTRTVDQLIDT